MNQAILYVRNNCQECERAKALLYHLDVPHLEYTLGEHFTSKQFASEFGERAEYPQITIDYKHIGGLKETLQYFKNNGVI